MLITKVAEWKFHLKFKEENAILNRKSTKRKERDEESSPRKSRQRKVSANDADDASNEDDCMDEETDGIRETVNHTEIETVPP